MNWSADQTGSQTTTYVELGEGLEVSPIGVGTMGLSPGVYGDVTDDDAIALIRFAVDRGAPFINTADAYGRGDGERLVGRAVAGRRERVTLATKFGHVGSKQGRPVDVGYRMKLYVDGSPQHVASRGDRWDRDSSPTPGFRRPDHGGAGQRFSLP